MQNRVGYTTQRTRTCIYSCTMVWNTVSRARWRYHNLPREQHSSVKVAVCKNQWSNQSPHVQHNANPAGRDLHPDRRPFAGHGLIRRIRTVEEGKEVICIFCFGVTHMCSNPLLNAVFPVDHLHFCATTQRTSLPLSFWIVHTDLYTTICKLVSQEGGKQQQSKKVFSMRSCQEVKICQRNL